MKKSYRKFITETEALLFYGPAIKNMTKAIKVTGVRGFVSTKSHPLINMVGLCPKLKQKNTRSIISKVVSQFQNKQQSFSWLVGPNSSYPWLEAQLLSVGFTPPQLVAGLVNVDFKTPTQINENICIAEVTAYNADMAIQAVAESYPVERPIADFLIQTCLLSPQSRHVLTKMYLASDKFGMPIAFAKATYFKSIGVVLLGGAATVQDSRGQGIYSALIAKRLVDAQAYGIHVAIAQCLHNTSAPICQKFGFQCVSDLKLYAWLASDENSQV